MNHASSELARELRGSDCETCGLTVGNWHADTALYEAVMGHPTELLCLGCFTRKATEKGIDVLVFDVTKLDNEGEQ